MAEHGVEVMAADNGDVWIPLAQPYGKFVNEMFTEQRYPEVKLVAGKDIVRPYDVAAWTLPLMMGVTVERAALPASLHTFSPEASGKPEAAQAERSRSLPEAPRTSRSSTPRCAAGGSVVDPRAYDPGELRPAGTCRPGRRGGARGGIGRRRAGVSWKAGLALPAASKSCGRRASASTSRGPPRWTRVGPAGFSSSTASIRSRSTTRRSRRGKLSEKFDAIVLPDVEKESSTRASRSGEEGEMKYFADLPREYAGGLEKEGGEGPQGVRRERRDARRVRVAASDYVADEFNIPVRNVLARTRGRRLLLPRLAPARQSHAGPSGDLRSASEMSRSSYDKPMAYATAASRDGDGALGARGVSRSRRATSCCPAGSAARTAWRASAAAVADDLRKGEDRAARIPPAAPRADQRRPYPFVFNALYWSYRGPVKRGELKRLIDSTPRYMLIEACMQRAGWAFGAAVMMLLAAASCTTTKVTIAKLATPTATRFPLRLPLRPPPRPRATPTLNACRDGAGLAVGPTPAFSTRRSAQRLHHRRRPRRPDAPRRLHPRPPPSRARRDRQRRFPRPPLAVPRPTRTATPVPDRPAHRGRPARRAADSRAADGDRHARSSDSATAAPPLRRRPRRLLTETPAPPTVTLDRRRRSVSARPTPTRKPGAYYEGRGCAPSGSPSPGRPRSPPGADSAVASPDRRGFWRVRRSPSAGDGGVPARHFNPRPVTYL